MADWGGGDDILEVVGGGCSRGYGDWGEGVTWLRVDMTLGGKTVRSICIYRRDRLTQGRE
jgi:hypothetical protein